MSQETVIEVTDVEMAETLEFDELFEELSVTELEDRLELGCRCLCKCPDDMT